MAQFNPKLHLTVMLQVLTCILVRGSARSNLAFGFRSPPLATDGTRTGLIELAPDEPETWMRNDLVANLRCIYQARALRAQGLLLADGTPTVEGGKTF